MEKRTLNLNCVELLSYKNANPYALSLGFVFLKNTGTELVTAQSFEPC